MEINFAKNPNEAAQPQPSPAAAPATVAAPIDIISEKVPAPTNAAPAVPAAPTAPVTAPAPTPAAETNTALAPQRPGGALAPTGLLLGDFIPEFKDIILPRINIVQGVGLLKDTFQQGQIVFGQNTVLFSPPVIDQKTQTIKEAATVPVTMTVCGFRPVRYVEKVVGGARGLIVNTPDEVTKAGGTLDYNEWRMKQSSGMKRFEPLAEAFVAIERPEFCKDDDTTFVYPVGGKKYALAIWAMKGTSYTAAAKRVFFTQRSVGCLKFGGYPSYAFSVSTRMEKNESNTYWVPVAVPKEKNSAEFLQFVAGILNPQA